MQLALVGLSHKTAPVEIRERLAFNSEALRLALTSLVGRQDVTEVIISHAHWDHLDGADLFPKATVYIQKDEYQYYTGEAWQ